MDSCDKVGECEILENERRRPLTDKEIEHVKDQLLESIYADIGKSIVKKVAWVFGAILLALAAWLTGAGHIKIGG